MGSPCVRGCLMWPGVVHREGGLCPEGFFGCRAVCCEPDVIGCWCLAVVAWSVRQKEERCVERVLVLLVGSLVGCIPCAGQELRLPGWPAASAALIVGVLQTNYLEECAGVVSCLLTGARCHSVAPIQACRALPEGVGRTRAVYRVLHAF